MGNSLLAVRGINHKYIVVERNFEFSEDGYPIFQKEMFLSDFPDLMVPINHRKDKRVVNPERTVLVYYCSDTDIYRRLDKLLQEIDEYKKFMGIVQPDVTVTADMDIEWQKAIMFLNQLVMAVLAANGIKIIVNTRMGIEETKDMFKYIPKRIMIASGFLGGTRKGYRGDFAYLSKVLYFLPQKLLIYGSIHESVCKQLDNMGIDYRVYKDFRNLCKEVA